MQALRTTAPLATRKAMALPLRSATLAPVPRLPLQSSSSVGLEVSRPTVIANAWTPSIKPRGGKNNYPNDHLTHTVEGTYESALFYLFFVMLMTMPFFAPAVIPLADWACTALGLDIMA